MLISRSKRNSPTEDAAAARQDFSQRLPGRYIGQAVTFGEHDPLNRHYSLVKDEGGGVTFWVYCPEKDLKPHEDESLVDVDELVEFVQNRGVEPLAVYKQLKALDKSLARSFKKRL